MNAPIRRKPRFARAAVRSVGARGARHRRLTRSGSCDRAKPRGGRRTRLHQRPRRGGARLGHRTAGAGRTGCRTGGVRRHRPERRRRRRGGDCGARRHDRHTGEQCGHPATPCAGRFSAARMGRDHRDEPHGAVRRRAGRAARDDGEAAREDRSHRIADVGIARPSVVPYTAAKGGLRQLTRGMAVELAPHNIQVNAIAPAISRRR